MAEQARMMLHAGGVSATFDEVVAVNTPPPTNTHYPVAHHKFVRSVEKYVADGGYEIKNITHALSHEGQRYFGLITLENEGLDGAYQWALGLRNSHDKKFKAEVTAGSRVFVCDNLAFSGTVYAVRKHTRYVERDMDNLIVRAVGQLGTYFNQNDRRYETYKDRVIDDKEFGHLVTGSIESRVVPVTKVPDVIREWREPTHEEFKERTVWSLFNAFTETFKKINNPSDLLSRNQALHGLMDAFCGFSAVQ